MPSEKATFVPTATPLEKGSPQTWIRFVFPMELGEAFDADEVFGVLKQGLEATKERLPELACEAVIDTDAKQAGVLKLQKCTDYDTLTKKDLRVDKAFPHTYAEIKSKRFPSQAFPGDILCRHFTWPSPGERLPVFDCQVNFINGGLLLTCCCLHVFGDAKAYYTWLEIWAEECRRLQGESGSHSEIPEEMFTDREKYMKPSGRNSGKPEDHPEVLVLPFTPPDTPPKMMSREHVGQIFRLTAEQLIQLKADSAPKYSSKPNGDHTWISTNDAVSALMWRSVMRAQFPLEDLKGDPTSVLNVAIDSRLRTNPLVHPRALGNWLGWICTQMSIQKMLERERLADPALAIRKAVLKLNTDYADDFGTLLESVEDIRRVVPAAFVDVTGFNCVHTSWINMGIYDINWGTKTLGGAIQSVRSPDVGVINGGSVVLPRLLEGGIEILIGVESKCLSRLLEDPLLAKYATAITL
ncbi:transferase family-domain-containing protein [Xylariaceae sp. FL0255]|nr:transferase family-domain-containing protein [Xylariaceae sp. FL0255]